MKPSETERHGLIAAFATPEALMKAAGRARERGFTCLDAFTPYPVEGLVEKLGGGTSRLPVYTFIGGAVGFFGILALQFYSVLIAYPVDVGGRHDGDLPGRQRQAQNGPVHDQETNRLPHVSRWS